MSRIRILLYPLFLVLLLAGCNSTESAKSQIPKSVWRLEADKESKETVILVKGMHKDKVRELLGTPLHASSSKKSPNTVKWTYKRTVVGPTGQKTIRSHSRGGGIQTHIVTQSILFVDTIKITFDNDIVNIVKIDRRHETIDNGNNEP